MRSALAILKMRMSILLQYRAATFAGICTQIFWGIILTMILEAFYTQASSVQTFSLQDAKSFVWINQALLMVVPWNVDKEIEEMIRTGNVAYEMLRPIHLYTIWFARALALRIIPTFLRCIPIFVVAGFFLNLSAPASWNAAILFSFSTLLSIFLSTTIVTLVMISLFWTISGEGLQRLLTHIVPFLSGLIIPLPLFPSWAQPFLYWQPFRGLMDIPCRFYTGIISLEDSLNYFALQLAWILIFLILGKALMKKALKKFVIHGG